MKAAIMDKGAGRDIFDCPVQDLTRNPVDGKPTGGYIFTAGLKTKQSSAKWILGVSLFMDVESWPRWRPPETSLEQEHKGWCCGALAGAGGRCTAAAPCARHRRD